MTVNGNIILIGFMGAKKTSLGYRLAYAANMSFIDTQAYIEDHQNRILSAISPLVRPSSAVGREREVIEIISAYSNLVVACDMKITADEYSMTKIKNSGFVVWLDCGFDAALERSSGREPFSAMNLHEREAYYRQYEAIFRHYADMAFDTSGPEDNLSMNRMCRNLQYELYCARHKPQIIKPQNRILSYV